MQPDGKPGHGAGPPHRIRRRGRADHKARRGQNAGAMPALDGVVHQFAEAEIIGGDDEALHDSTRSDRAPRHDPSKQAT